jgi:hypothetical protein
MSLIELHQHRREALDGMDEHASLDCRRNKKTLDDGNHQRLSNSISATL